MNANHQALIARGQGFRIATQQRGRARVYVAGHFATFFSNNTTAATLEKNAPNARPDTHLGRALAELQDEIESGARRLAAAELAELLEAIPEASSRKARAL